MENSCKKDPVSIIAEKMAAIKSESTQMAKDCCMKNGAKVTTAMSKARFGAVPLLFLGFFVALLVFPSIVMSSRGDRDYTFHNCLAKCKQNNCIGAGKLLLSNGFGETHLAFHFDL